MRNLRSLIVVSILFVLGCGRDETMASKSAAAYREAQAKGTVVAGGHEHGGHEVATATGGTAEIDHSAHGTGTDPHAGHDMTTAAADHSAHHGTTPAIDHAAMGHAATGHAATGHGTIDHRAHGTAADHAQHGATTPAAAGHEGHAAAAGTAAHDQHAGMQHQTATDPHAHHRQPAAAAAHAGHGATPQPAAGAPSVVLRAPTSSAEMARTRPAATLQPDEFDAPAAIAVEEAKKAAGAGGGEHKDHEEK